mgnify:CR=1 FL=1
MTVSPTQQPEASASLVKPTTARSYRIWLYIGVILVALSTTRVFTGADDITSAGTLRAAMIAAIPIALAGLGGLWSERAGVVNIGLEGMMILGTLGAGYFTYHYGVWVGLMGAALFGAVGGALHALATVTFGVDHIVSGVAINIIAAGVASFLAEALFTGLPGGGPTQSPSLDRPPTVTIPGLDGFTSELAAKGWFLISDLAALVNAGLLSGCRLLLVPTFTPERNARRCAYRVIHPFGCRISTVFPKLPFGPRWMTTPSSPSE